MCTSGPATEPASITMMNDVSTGTNQPFDTLSPLIHEQLILHRSAAASDWLNLPSTEGDCNLTFDRVYFRCI